LSSEDSEDDFANICDDLKHVEEDTLLNYEDLNCNQPLYRGAAITVNESMLAILTLLIHHNLDMSCIEDIISVMQLHCLQTELKKISLYKFSKYFSFIDSGIIKNYYCKFCTRDLTTVDEECPSCPKKKEFIFCTIVCNKTAK